MLEPLISLVATCSAQSHLSLRLGTGLACGTAPAHAGLCRCRVRASPLLFALSIASQITRQIYSEPMHLAWGTAGGLAGCLPAWGGQKELGTGVTLANKAHTQEGAK